MTLDQIEAAWGVDSVIDDSKLADESLKIPRLHHKYYTMYLQERLLQRKLEADHRELKMAKYEFYTQGPQKESPQEWKLPARGRILKAEVQPYMDSDPDIIKLLLRVQLQQEKVEFLDSIIKTFKDRGFLIKNAIEFMRFQMGG